MRLKTPKFIVYCACFKSAFRRRFGMQAMNIISHNHRQITNTPQFRQCDCPEIVFYALGWLDLNAFCRLLSNLLSLSEKSWWQKSRVYLLVSRFLLSFSSSLQWMVRLRCNEFMIETVLKWLNVWFFFCNFAISTELICSFGFPFSPLLNDYNKRF